MPSKSYVALLRGINVGGKNLIAMPALKSCFEERGYENVATYIQSGNVLFDATSGKRRLAQEIETMLEVAFGIPLTVVVRSHKELSDVVANAPKGFGRQPKKYLYDAIFLKEPLTANQAMKHVTLKEGIDQVDAGKGVLYSARLASKAPQSRLSRFAGSPVYKSVTVRNWNTTTKLLALLDQRTAS